MSVGARPTHRNGVFVFPASLCMYFVVFTDGRKKQEGDGRKDVGIREALYAMWMEET